MKLEIVPGGAPSTRRALRVSGTVERSATLLFPWSGVTYPPLESAQQSADLSAWQALAFWAIDGVALR